MKHKNHKDNNNIIIAIFGMLVIMAVIVLGSFWYKTHFEVAVVDTIQSEDGVYEVILQSVGEPAWPFGSASGQLILSSDKSIISKTDFKIANDGASFSAQSWSVTWYDNYVEVILSGEEQYDELVTLYYDGQILSRRLTTRYGAEEKSVSDDNEKGETDTESASGVELFPDEWRITAGYQAIYELYSDNSIDSFEVYYGASESSTRCVLSENENTIEYLFYNGKSENEKCGLYVRYYSNKNSDGTWSYADGKIADIYAYVYESGDVVSSGKTQWEDTGSEDFRKVTGEK